MMGIEITPTLATVLPAVCVGQCDVQMFTVQGQDIVFTSVRSNGA